MVSLFRLVISFSPRMRCPDELIQLLHSHYDNYKAENSGPRRLVLGSVVTYSLKQVLEFLDFNLCLVFDILFFHPVPTSLPAGVPHDMLQMDFFVPGSTTRREHERYRGKALFAEILAVTKETTMTYFLRLVQDIPLQFRLFPVESMVCMVRSRC